MYASVGVLWSNAFWSVSGYSSSESGTLTVSDLLHIFLELVGQFIAQFGPIESPEQVSPIEQYN